MRIALFPGSFNPFTTGHLNIANRALQLFDKVVIAVGVNINKEDCNTNDLTTPIKEIFKNNPQVEVISYSNLTADLVKEVGACCIVRGLRNSKDLKYENDIATANYTLFGVETVFLLADPQLKEVSSSLVRELKKFGKDINDLIPKH